jgi:hypothetical protein
VEEDAPSEEATRQPDPTRRKIENIEKSENNKKKTI